jgi:hypothetical protein
MKGFHLKPSAAVSAAVTMLISGWLGLACASQSPLGPDTPPKNGDVEGVMIIQLSELETIRASYVVSESKGEITGVGTCATHVGDDACLAAARHHLGEEAKKRGADLAVITDTLLRPMNPAQIALRATLHQITAR